MKALVGKSLSRLADSLNLQQSKSVSLEEV